MLNWPLAPSSGCNPTGETIKRGLFIYLGNFISVYLPLCVITNLFVIRGLARRGAAEAAMQVCSTLRLSDQVSATSCFGLLQNHQRGSHLALRIFTPPTLKPLASFEQTRFWIGGGRGAFKSPKLWLAAPSACPSYWHLVLLYQLLIKQCSRTASVKISMQRETGVRLPAVASRFWNKSRMLAFHY